MDLHEIQLGGVEPVWLYPPKQAAPLNPLENIGFHRILKNPMQSYGIHWNSSKYIEIHRNPLESIEINKNLFKSIENPLKSIENQLKSIENPLKSIENLLKIN